MHAWIFHSRGCLARYTEGLIAFGSIVSLAIILLFPHVLSKGIWWTSWQSTSLPFCLFCEFILSLSTVMFETLLKCAVLCYGYATRLFLFLVKTIHMSFQVLVCFTQFLCLRIERLQHLFISGWWLFPVLHTRIWRLKCRVFLFAFIYTNITILCLLFIFRYAQIILFALNIIHTWSLFFFIRARSNFIVAFR